MLFFFFKQKTAYEMRISDWSSDVCSSDLCGRSGPASAIAGAARCRWQGAGPDDRGASETDARADRHTATWPTPVRVGTLEQSGHVMMAHSRRSGYASTDVANRIASPLLDAHGGTHVTNGDRKSTRLNSSQ